MTNDPLSHLQQDPVLARIIAETQFDNPVQALSDPAAALADVPETDRLYVALLKSIVGQQISVRAADAIFRRFRMLFSETADAEGYPAPALLLQKTSAELRAAGLSGQKATYLQSVAEFALAHPLTTAHVAGMTDEEIVQYLIPIRGVGRWTVEMLLMFVLNRPDVFPVDDLIIRQKMIRAYSVTETGRPLYRRLQEIARPWQPYRTLACRYLWRWKPASPPLLATVSLPETPPSIPL